MIVFKGVFGDALYVMRLTAKPSDYGLFNDEIS
jgi:hypothetical protein